MIQLELTPDAEQFLQTEAVACGCSSAEFAAKIISAYASAKQSGNASDSFAAKDAFDAREWILSQNPNLLTNTPQNVDWQQLKAEGRRY